MAVQITCVTNTSAPQRRHFGLPRGLPFPSGKKPKYFHMNAFVFRLLTNPSTVPGGSVEGLVEDDSDCRGEDSSAMFPLFSEHVIMISF